MPLLWQARTLKDFTRLELVRPEQAQDLGGGTFRAEVRFGDQVPGYSDARSLWDISQLAFREGDECAFGLSLMLRDDWIGWFPKNDELGNWPTRGIHGGSLMEFHHAPSNGDWSTLRPGSAPFYLIAKDEEWGAYLLETDPKSFNFGGLRPAATWDLGPIQRGQWTDFVVHALWSTDPAKGYIEIFADGQQVVPRFHSATLYPGTFVYPQAGLYRRGFIGDPSLTWWASAKSAVTYPPRFTPRMGAKVFPEPGGYPQSVQLRNLRIGRTKEDVMATTPTSPTTPQPAAPAPAMSAAQKTDWLNALMAARDDLQTQAAALHATADGLSARANSITAMLNKGTY